ncbi:MAG TPA: NADH-quinone oxidoreductase subunit L [Tepidisphaeraceae bacterium]|jgi:proton-translocating NADH-quinone oxidoreductase chain L|nr:NADH-quinone oxidoreductase subunit L [Tepidisphaeraceae bacterium]
MPLPSTLLLLATLLPLGSFTLLLFTGKRLSYPLAGIVATAFIIASFACTIAAMIAWLNVTPASVWGAGKGPIFLSLPWLPFSLTPNHPSSLTVGIYLDSLTIALFAMVTTVAAAVHVFSIGYMRHDPRFHRYFTYLSLFCFSMLALLLSSTLIELLVFWELVGLCSYLLIGFWFEKRSAANASLKAFLTNRLGDLGFLIGISLLISHLGNTSFPHLWTSATEISPNTLTLIGILLFTGAIAKSAQFPLHTWLPDAMEAPTPISALIHAATMVAAGVYLTARLFPILTPDAKLFIAIIGLITLTIGALIATAQTDIKRILAYSTISQLGYMMLAIGVGSWVGALFHLITHAFFKSLLFLAAGSVIHAAGHEQELSHFGGLARKIPVTAATFAIALLAMSGAPFFAGYYSKELILTHAASFSLLSASQSAPRWYALFFYLPVAIAYLTPFYMTRCWMLTFHGRPRNLHLFARARETWILYVPLILLAVLSTWVGAKGIGIRELIERSITESNAYCQSLTSHPNFSAFSTAWPANLPIDQDLTPSQQLMEQGHMLTQTRVAYAWLAGILLGILLYLRGFLIPNLLLKFPPLRWLHIWLYRAMYFDELYHLFLVGPVLIASHLANFLDTHVIDPIVNLTATSIRSLANLASLNDEFVIDASATGIAHLSQNLGSLSRSPQTGRIRTYILLLFTLLTLAIASTILLLY